MVISSPIFWTHLEYYESTYWGISPKDLAFIEWWREKQGTIPPFLSSHVPHADEDPFGADNLDASPWEVARYPVMVYERMTELTTVIEYMGSAQYLKISTSFWNILLREFERGSHTSYPNLHTLSGDWDGGQPSTISYPRQYITDLFPHCSPSFLQRLHLYDARFKDGTVIQPHLSRLTHISLENTALSLDFWHFFIRSFPDLQWASFSVELIKSDSEHHLPISEHTLSHLSVLFFTARVGFSRAKREDIDFLSPYFAGLSLPTLHMLSLSSDHDSWTDYRGVAQICNVLKSTPNVIDISFGPHLFSFDYFPFYLDIDDDTDSFDDLRPLWLSTPHLVHVQFEISVGSIHSSQPKAEVTMKQAERQLETFIHYAFAAENEWLDLKDPVFPIRKITLVYDQAVRIRTFAALQLRGLNEMWPNIDFQIVSVSPRKAAMEAWNEWGSCV
ncbi:hypothetical protein BDN70DRAFT_938666 [Pholiota conissans]|uniref:Uncharacterized protein n=1 Tax=Pholiota conissans TaxID=109636 RepID=A0A9P5YNG7_9AGAR|nr:hypothetical protein BDN70DRAFT_938666 [Pholiota conissans]